MKVGVILARFQPIHNGHIELIKYALHGNEVVHIFIGSADKFNVRNPIPIHERRRLVTASIKEVFTDEEMDRIFIHELPDLDSESNNSIEWGFYLYSHIVHEIKQAEFSLYYSDGYELVSSWFPGFMFKDFISLVLMARNSCVHGVSATLIREAIINDDIEFLRKNVSDIVFEARDSIKRYIQLSELRK